MKTISHSGRELCVQDHHYDRLRGCFLKIRYKNKKAAKEAIDQHEIEMHSYWCRFCKGFHLTSKNNRNTHT